MSEYYSDNSKKKRRGRREKIGFYTAFSICLIAVGMAVYSTYSTLSGNSEDTTVPTSQAQQVNNTVTGVTEATQGVQIDISVPTIAATEPSESARDTGDSSRTALETMLSADVTLSYPLESGSVLKEYSEDSVYFKTLNVWKPHTGVDFGGKLGDDVFAMTGGAVTDVYEDAMFGDTVEISTNNIVCIYSGLEAATVKKGETVEAGEKIASLGAVPCEAGEKDHIHVSIKVDGEYADPLSFIKNNE